MKRLVGWVLGVALLAGAPAGATVAQTASDTAKTPEARDSDWHFTMPLGVFRFGIKGPAGIGKFTQEVDLDSGDVSDLVDKAAGLSLDFGKGNWTGITSATYIKFEGAERAGKFPNGTTIRVQPSLEMTIVSGAVAYRAYVHDPGPKMFSIEPLGGLRYTKLKATLEVTSPTNNERSADVSWEDVFAGFRMVKSFTPHFNIVLSADYGIAIANNSEPSYNASLTGGWRFPFNGWSLTAFGGYKLQNVQYEDDPDHRYHQDLDMTGPVAGVAFSW